MTFPFDDFEYLAKGERSAFARTILTRSELAALPPVEALIEGTLSKRVSAVVAGPTGVGKSFVALSWACSVSTGVSWLGKSVSRCPALYLLGEGARGFDARVDAWEQTWGVTVRDEDVGFSVKPASLMDQALWAEVTDEALDRKVGLIILDTLSSLAPDADETKDSPIITRRMSDLAESTGAAVVLVHHPGWSDSSRVRGGYQFEGNPDEVFILHGGPMSALFELEFKKVKEGVAGGRQWLRRQPAFGSVIVQGARPDEVRLHQADATAIFICDLYGGELRSQAEIRDAIMTKFTVQRSQAYERVKQLLAAGILQTAGGTDARPMYRVSFPP